LTEFPLIGPKETVYQNQYQEVYRVGADFGDFKKEYFVTDYGTRSGVIVIDEGRVLLVRQYRLMLRGLSWEIPSGRVIEGESP
tara:strand:+ start:225 stop:473 length:249 start_codon:yes stop_codon:yes gene_type:complete